MRCNNCSIELEDETTPWSFGVPHATEPTDKGEVTMLTRVLEPDDQGEVFSAL